MLSFLNVIHDKDELLAVLTHLAYWRRNSIEPKQPKPAMTQVEKDMREVARIVHQREKPTPRPIEPTQIVREVARILNDRPLPAITQWKIVAGMIALIMLGIGATIVYAQTIKPQHQIEPARSLSGGNFFAPHDTTVRYSRRMYIAPYWTDQQTPVEPY